MNILILQTGALWREPDENRRRLEAMIASAPQADLILLPEMFTTGFATHPAGAAEAEGPTLEWMRAKAREKGAAVAGSVAVEAAGRYYNRFYFVKPDGSHAAYDKRHLFTFAGEDRHYTPGAERVIVEHAGFRILLQVCYDLRFPVFARNRGDYDMILYTAAWPSVRRGAWDTLIRARAIENVCYVAAANRTGEDPGVAYDGGSAIIDFRGETLAAAVGDGEQIVAGEAGLASLEAFRTKFPALDDADDFTLHSK